MAALSCAGQDSGHGTEFVKKVNHALGDKDRIEALVKWYNLFQKSASVEAQCIAPLRKTRILK
jgi:hypothetical protein